MKPTVKLWIDPQLNCRHSVNGWPDMNRWHPGHGMKEDYLNALEKAKAESLYFEDKNYMYTMCRGLNWIADTFIDLAGSVEVAWQRQDLSSRSKWTDYTGEMAEGVYRQIARFIPARENEERPTDPFKTFPACNWDEDYEHENGNYINTCIECKMPFKGHKRRVICKMCAGPNWEELAKKQAPPDNKCAHAGCWGEGEMVGFARCMVKKVMPLQKENADLRARLEKAEAENKHMKALLEKYAENE